MSLMRFARRCAASVAVVMLVKPVLFADRGNALPMTAEDCLCCSVCEPEFRVYVVLSLEKVVHVIENRKPAERPRIADDGGPVGALKL